MNQPKQDNWYAIGGSAALGRGEVQPVHLFGIERVAWRGEDGESHVWHNRCIHRGMRLNYGYVDGDRLACRYHGWRFGGDGKCAYIPAHPDMTPPDDFCIPAAPSAEAGELIWTSVGTPDGPPPDLSSYSNLTFCRTVAINRGAGDIEAALNDASIPAFAPSETDAGYSARELAPGLFAVEAGTGESLVLAVQPVNDGKTNLHVLADAEAGSEDIAEMRRRFSAWARRFRLQLENALPSPERD